MARFVPRNYDGPFEWIELAPGFHFNTKCKDGRPCNHQVILVEKQREWSSREVAEHMHEHDIKLPVIAGVGCILFHMVNGWYGFDEELGEHIQTITSKKYLLKQL